MPFVPLAALLFLLGDVFEGYQQQDDPASVPLLTPHAGGGINPSPPWVVHGRPAFSRACAALHGCSEWAIVLLLPAGPVPDPDEYSVPEVVRISNVPHDPHVAVTSLRDGGAVEQGSVVVYQPSCSATVWGAEYTTALDAIKSVCGCDLAWRPHAVYRPKVVLSPELTASSAASLGRVVQSPHSDVAWLEPHRYCWVPVATNNTSSDASPQGDDATNVALASHGIPTWTGAIYGTVPEAEIIGAAAYLLHTPPSACMVHVVDASIIGAHLRRAQEALYRGIKGPTSHLVNEHALSWIVEGLRRLPRRVGGPHHWVVRQSSHLAAVPLEAPDSAAARAMAPPLHLVLPKEHAILLVPGDNGELEPRVPSMQALQQVREMEWPFERHAPGPTRHWLAPARRCPWELYTTAQRTEICCGHVTVACPQCRSCDGGDRSSRVWQYRPTPVSSVGGRRRTWATCACCVRGTRRLHAPYMSRIVGRRHIDEPKLTLSLRTRGIAAEAQTATERSYYHNTATTGPAIHRSTRPGVRAKHPPACVLWHN